MSSAKPGSSQSHSESRTHKATKGSAQDTPRQRIDCRHFPADSCTLSATGRGHFVLAMAPTVKTRTTKARRAGSLRPHTSLDESGLGAAGARPQYRFAVKEIRVISVEETNARWPFLCLVSPRSSSSGSRTPPVDTGESAFAGSLQGHLLWREREFDSSPYVVKRSWADLVALDRQLSESFELLLDTVRGGPPRLSTTLVGGKLRTLTSRKGHRISRDALERRRSEADAYFCTLLRAGGEVVGSSRAMQDFL